MKQLSKIIIMVVFIMGNLLAQKQIADNKKSDSEQNGPKVEQVEIERDYFSDMQRSGQKNKDVFKFQPEKTAVVKDMKKTNSSSKIYSSENVKPNQIIRVKEMNNFGQGKDQFHSQKKSGKKVNSVEGFAAREEIKKIEGHAPHSEEVLIQALGQPKPVKAKASKAK